MATQSAQRIPEWQKHNQHDLSSSDDEAHGDGAGCCGFGDGGSSDISDDDAARWAVLHGAVPGYIRNAFIKKVYAILSVQLLVTVGISAAILSVPEETLVDYNWGLVMQVDAILMLVMVFGLSCCRCGERMMRTFPQNYIFLGTLTILVSILTGSCCLAYDTDTVIIAAGLTTGIFFALTAYACLTRTDFTGLGPYLFILLACLVGASFIGIFLQIPMYDLVIAAVSCVLFSFYIIYDTQLIVGGSHKRYQFGIDEYCFAALNLYMDIINLFLGLLRIVGGRNN